MCFFFLPIGTGALVPDRWPAARRQRRHPTNQVNIKPNQIRIKYLGCTMYTGTIRKEYQHK
jgi:hypothetical protein